MKIVYLATPFSYHPNPNERLGEIHAKVAEIQRSYPEVLIVSAILYYSVLVPNTPGVEKNLGFWYSASSTLVATAEEVWIWNPLNVASSGVDLEVREADRFDKPIRRIS